MWSILSYTLFICFFHSSTMRYLWPRVCIIGSATFGSLLWSQKKTESDQSACTSSSADQSSVYELKLVQVLFRHGARTPLKSIPDVIEVRLNICCYFVAFLFLYKVQETKHVSASFRPSGSPRYWSLLHTATLTMWWQIFMGAPNPPLL